MLKFPYIKGTELDIFLSMLKEANSNNKYREKIIFVKTKSEFLSFEDN
jgi:hypothetical protein